MISEHQTLMTWTGLDFQIDIQLGAHLVFLSNGCGKVTFDCNRGLLTATTTVSSVNIITVVLLTLLTIKA